jgi:hypothetical protein
VVVLPEAEFEEVVNGFLGALGRPV